MLFFLVLVLGDLDGFGVSNFWLDFKDFTTWDAISFSQNSLIKFYQNKIVLSMLIIRYLFLRFLKLKIYFYFQNIYP